MNIEKSTIEAVYVVAYLLRKASDEGRELDPLQINKLVYICHGWALGILKKPMIENRSNQIQAWKYGPVVQEVYDLLKGCGSQKLSYTSFCNILGSNGIGKNAIEEVLEKQLGKILEKKPEMCKIIDMVWYVYKDVSGGQLITLTHKNETPWKQHVKKNIFGQVVHGVHIPDPSIAAHYEDKLRDLTGSSDE